MNACGQNWGWITRILNVTACGEEPIPLLVMETVIHYNQYDYNDHRDLRCLRKYRHRKPGKDSVS